MTGYAASAVCRPHNAKLSGGVSRPLERRVRRSVLLYAEPPNNEVSGCPIGQSA